MVNFLFVAIAVILLDIVIGLPLTYVLYATGADYLVLLTVGALEVILPMGCIFLEMRQRSAYPIRVEVSYEIGKDSAGIPKVISYEDRLGLIETESKENKATGAKEWKLMKIGRIVQKFEYKYVYEKSIWFGFKKAPHAKVIAVQGIQGEEFYPIKYSAGLTDEKGGEFRPVFNADRALMHYKLLQDIDKRNTKKNFWQENIWKIAELGVNFMIIAMLFLIFLQLVDVSKNLALAAGANNAAADTFRQLQNQSNAAKGISPGTVAGVPFGATTT